MINKDSYDRVCTLLEAPSPKAAAETLYEILQPGGLAGLVYSSNRIPEPLVEGCDAVHRWVKHFVQSNYFAIDPLYSAAKKSVVPQYWRANQQRPSASAAEIRLYREIGEFGIAQGFDLSIRDHQDEASLCFYYVDPSLDLQQFQPLAQLGTLYLHECVLRRAQLAASAASSKLTPREQECLLLVQQGLTYLQIGQRLAISERTVTFHLQNTKKKLGVNTLAQATAKVLS